MLEEEEERWREGGSLPQTGTRERKAKGDKKQWRRRADEERAVVLLPSV